MNYEELKTGLKAILEKTQDPAGIDTGSYGSLHEFGTELYNRWNLGDKKTNRGLLILLVTNPDEREISFVTGYGLEGLLPDAYCKRIQSNIMVPLMRVSTAISAPSESLAKRQ